MRHAITIAVASLASAVIAQPINLDLNDHWGTPGDDHAGASGQAGFWNVTNGFDAFSPPLPLMGLDGSPSGASLSFPLSFGNPGTGNVIDPIDDPFSSLIDDGLLTTDIPERIRISGLEEGDYLVYVYGCSLDDVATTWITQGENMLTSGGWNGEYEEGVNFDATVLPTVDGRIDVDWVTGSPEGFGWASGIQLVPVGACAADCNRDGSLDILDFVCFQNLFTSGEPAADCNGDGSLNILDFVCFQGVFVAGCP